MILKVAALAVVGILVLALLSMFFDSNLRFSSNLGLEESGSFQRDSGVSVSPSAPSPSPEYDFASGEVGRIYYPPVGGTTGDDAEEFEVTEYTARIETRNKERDCAIISALKSRTYVIFENANEYENGCDYVFKVEVDRTEEILSIVRDLDPRDLRENVYTIKQQIENYDTEIEILERKLESIEQTLEDAIAAYEEITQLATENRDAQTLAIIIDSKIDTIEKLTQERIRVTEQLDRLGQARLEQVDRLDYTNFYVNIDEDKYLDWENVKDSWKAAVQDFVRAINTIVQGLTIGLLALLLLAAQYLLYLIILLVIAKYGWKFAKDFWKK